MTNNYNTGTFTQDFRELGSKFPFVEIEGVIKSVLSDYEVYSDTLQSDMEGLTYEINTKYNEQPVDYIVLWNFARYYIDGIDESIAIQGNFSKSKIKSFKIPNMDNTHKEKIEINDNCINDLIRNKRQLEFLFEKIGKNLFPDFVFEDFFNKSDYNG